MKSSGRSSVKLRQRKSQSAVASRNATNKDARVSWASNVDPEHPWNLCEGCQVIEFGGWPAGFGRIISDKENETQATQPSLKEVALLVATAPDKAADAVSWDTAFSIGNLQAQIDPLVAITPGAID